MFRKTTYPHCRTALFPLLALTVALTLGGCATTTRGNIPVGSIPPADQPSAEQIGTTRALIDQRLTKEQGHKVYSKGARQRRVQTIVDRLARAAGARDFSYPAYVADAGDEANAMAINGNTIVIYRALLDRVRSDAELATVLAHEVAHIVADHADDNGTEQRRDSVRAGGAALGVLATVAAAVAGAGGAADFAGAVTETVTVTIGEGAIVRAYDRATEHEADHVGLMIMAKAGYDPRAALSFWERADVIFGGDGESSSSFFSTHPDDERRAERLREAMPLALQYYAPVE